MITAVILTKNEENNIVDCIESISFCDQIVVIDDNSNDRTLEILKLLKNQNRRIEIYKRELKDNFASQRNFGISKSKNEWILFVDADERITSDLKNEIQNSVRRREINGFYLRRRDNIWGRELRYGESGNIWLLRLGKKSAGKWESTVHEVWNIQGKTEKLGGTLYHFPHQSITEFLNDLNFYTDLRAKELYAKGVRSGAISVILYPKLKFILNYFLKLGILDGVAGLLMAVFMSFHSFLVRGKLWQISRK